MMGFRAELETREDTSRKMRELENAKEQLSRIRRERSLGEPYGSQGPVIIL